MPTGTGSLGAFAGAAAVTPGALAVGVGAQYSVAPADRLALFGQGLLLPFPDGGAAVALVALRWQAVDLPAFRLAPMLTMGIVQEWYWDHVWPPIGSVGVGAALEGGSDLVRFDLSVPSIVGVGPGYRHVAVAPNVTEAVYAPIVPHVLQVGAEVGMTFRCDSGFRTRLGLPTLLQVGFESERHYVGASMTFLFLAVAVTGHAGVRF